MGISINGESAKLMVLNRKSYLQMEDLGVPHYGNLHVVCHVMLLLGVPKNWDLPRQIASQV